VLRALVQTHLPIQRLNKSNLKVPTVLENKSQPEFPAYKPNPIRIQSFLHKIQIMTSKEKPKKITILGTNSQKYNFLLKCDKQSDLRKEQRFIDFAVFCNKMLN